MITQSPRATLDDLPLLATQKQAAAVMGLTERQVNGLLDDERLAYVWIGKRRMIPRNAIQEFITENTVMPCRDETQEPASDSWKSEAATTSAGPSKGAAGSAARAQHIAKELKSRSL